jgi:hypothetical protein
VTAKWGTPGLAKQEGSTPLTAEKVKEAVSEGEDAERKLSESFRRPTTRGGWRSLHRRSACEAEFWYRSKATQLPMNEIASKGWKD